MARAAFSEQATDVVARVRRAEVEPLADVRVGEPVR
jgi:hypothetical protein